MQDNTVQKKTTRPPKNKKQDKIIPIIISVIAIIGLVFVIRSIIAPDSTPIPTETTSVAEQPVAVYEDPTTQPAEPEYTAPIAEPKPQRPEPKLIKAPTSLEDSDPQVLLAIADFAPGLAKWLLPTEQIRKWVLAVDLMADGKLPKRYRPLDYPMGKFMVEQQNQGTVATKTNYSRMNALIKTLTSIEPEQLASYYHLWLPTLEQAYREQGKPDTFDQRFRQTISQVLAAPPLSNNPALTRPSVLYRYADDTIEQASDIDKLLWRMGPENSSQLQDFLRELRHQIDQ